MSENQTQVHAVLRGYKDSRDPGERARKTLQLAALVATFFDAHEACVGEFDLVATVPSLLRNAPAQIVNQVRSLRDRRKDLLHLSRRVGHQKIDPAAFEVVGDVTDQRIVLFDDTFTTGSAIYSAAAAIESCGGLVVCGVVVGRHVNEWPTNALLMEWLRPLPWREDECCICAGARPLGQLPL